MIDQSVDLGPSIQRMDEIEKDEQLRLGTRPPEVTTAQTSSHVETQSISQEEFKRIIESIQASLGEHWNYNQKQTDGPRQKISEQLLFSEKNIYYRKVISDTGQTEFHPVSEEDALYRRDKSMEKISTGRYESFNPPKELKDNEIGFLDFMLEQNQKGETELAVWDPWIKRDEVGINFKIVNGKLVMSDGTQPTDKHLQHLASFLQIDLNKLKTVLTKDLDPVAIFKHLRNNSVTLLTLEDFQALSQENDEKVDANKQEGFAFSRIMGFIQKRLRRAA